MDISEKIIHIINNNTLETSIVELSKIIESDDRCWLAYLERGKLYWKEGKVKNAITDYLAADRINPHSQPKEILTHTLEILQFRNTDLLNP